MHLTIIYALIYIVGIILIFAAIVFYTPKRYFRFTVDWTIISFTWLYSVIVQIKQTPDRHIAYLWAIAFLIIFSFILLLRFQLLSMGIGDKSLNQVTVNQKNNIFKVIGYVTFAAYSLMAIKLVTIMG